MNVALRSALSALSGAAVAGALVAVCVSPSPGPDVIVAELSEGGPWKATSSPVSGFHAYSIGTDSVNVGDQDLQWVSNTRFHPVIGQNMYRWKQDASRPGGRLEQVGMSWLKHGFFALEIPEFCNCDDNPGTGSLLGPGCSDPYDTSLNGSRPLGLRSEVNPTSGFFVYPPTVVASPEADDQRLRIATADLESSSTTVRYFGEAQYVSPDDAEAGNARNNATFREATLDGAGNFLWGGALGTYPGQQRQEAIRAWKRIDGEVRITRVDYEENFLPARFNVAVKVHDLGGGIWRYEYAVHNLNSHRSARELSIPLSATALVEGTGSHDIDHHSGEPYSTDGWSVDVDLDADTVRWFTTTHAGDPNANALRWGTMFNFWFDSDVPPGTGTATLGLFRPGGAGEPDALEFETIVPGGVCLHCDGFESGDDLRWSGQY